MSRYLARIVLPDGVERYLSRGRTVYSQENATHYPHPSSAERAIDSYRSRRKTRLYADVIDTRDYERVVR